MIWLKDVIKDLKEIQETTRQEFENLSAEELIWKPAADKWSIAECLKHIIIANSTYIKDIEKRLQKAEVKTIEYPVRFSVTGKLFLYAVDPKYKWKVPAPRIFKPTKENKVRNGKETLQDFLDLQEEIIGLALKACAYDHQHVPTYSPLSKLLRFNVGEQLYIMMRHTKRHINQGKRVKSQFHKSVA
ncbi:DinB family protein [uncultured Marivirga sp.]|uniref:DinB family protein n=1 Tax=uncultured Marivirga sp. TaxID=1123707 RepID=UPI0030EC94DF|tara:strand:+ start:49890 stop:50450 length:561 start_codon:yes stop_codon:yes gene_type:complete